MEGLWFIKKYSIIGLLIIIHCFNLIAKVPSRYLAGTYQSLAVVYRAYSPLRGVSLIESGWLQNFYDLGPDDAMHTLVTHNQFGFFNKIKDDPNLYVSTSSGNLTNFLFDPANDLHADLVKIIVQRDFSPTTIENFSAILFEQWKKKQIKKRTQKEEEQVKGRIELLLQTIQEALQEEQKGLYAPNTTIGIIVGHLYLLAKGNNMPFLAYAQQLEQLVPGIGLLHSLQQAAPFSATSPKQKDNPEYVVYKIINSRRLPLVQRGRVYVDAVPFSDCGEVTLNNLFNMILYNQSTRSFDLGLLPATVHPREEFIQFYEKIQPDLTYIGREDVKNAWANLIAKKEACGIEYREDAIKAEIKAYYGNMLAMINCLLNLKVNSFKELAEKLSTSDHVIDVIKETLTTEEAQIVLGIGGLFDQTMNFSMKPGHAWCSYVTPEKIKKVSKQFDVITELIAQPVAQDFYLLYSDVIDIKDKIVAIDHLLRDSALDPMYRKSFENMLDLILKKEKERSAEIIASLLLENKMSDSLLADIMHKNEQVRRKIMPELILSNVQLNDITPKLELLLQYGADINEAFGGAGNTPLIFAIKRGMPRIIIQFLLEHGADVRKADGFGKTPLKAAKQRALVGIGDKAITENKEIIELLLQYRAKD